MLLQKKIHLFIFLLLIVAFTATAQTPVPKLIPAKRIVGSILIDGELNDTAWLNAPVAKEFIELRPNPFKKESK